MNKETLVQLNERYNKQDSLALLDEVACAFADFLEDGELIPDCISACRQKVEYYYSVYEGGDTKLDTEQLEYAFIVHTRDTEAAIQAGYCYNDAVGEFAELAPLLDIIQSVPQLQSKLYEFTKSLPPRILAKTSVTVDGEQINGAIILLPVDLDQSNGEGSRLKLIKQLRATIIPDIKDFVVNTLDIHNIGLGAILPSVTNKGQLLKRSVEEGSDLYTTTGHAGTLRLMVETFKVGVEKAEVDLDQYPVYILGCGAIGSAFTELMLDEIDSKNTKLVLVDSSLEAAQKLQQRVCQNRENASIELLTTNDFQHAIDTGEVQVVVCATDSLQPNSYKNWQNIKLIIDDSQPVQWWRGDESELFNLAWPIAVTSQDIYKRNGLLFSANSTQPTLDNPMNYGTTSGLRDGEKISLFGCEAEIACLAFYGLVEKLGVSHTPTEKDIAEITKLFKLAHIFVDAPLQSFGRDSVS